MEQVSIHAPAGGATYERAKYGAYTEGFNPRARGGRDGTLSCVSRFIAVSIHAPAGGATAECKLAMPLPFPFQSTRPRGARRTKCSTPLRLSKFQSTRPRGARLLSIYALNSQYITYTISRTFSFASLLIYYSIYFFCKYFITRFCDPTSFLATLHVRVH